MKRIVALVASVFMAASLTLFISPSSAHASTATKATEGRSLTGSDALTARRQCLPTHRKAGSRTVNLCARVKGGKIVLSGRVFPKYGHKRVLLQYKKKKGGNWHTVQRDRTTPRGKYHFASKRAGYYRTKARAGNGYKASFSNGWFHFYRY